jgi:hypothetical protein
VFALLLLSLPGFFVVADSSCQASGEVKAAELKYKLVRRKDEVIEIKLISAPPYVVSLTPSPKEKEKILKKGTWLVVCVSVLSASDQVVAHSAFKAVRGLNTDGGVIKLGLRPYRSEKEFAPWFPEARDLDVSPIWIIFREGRVLATHAGYFRGSSEENRVKAARTWLESVLRK